MPGLTAIATSGDGTRLLIVDSTEFLAEATVLTLRTSAFMVDMAHDAAQAMSKIAQFQPHVVLTEIMLPGLNGMEFARKLKADPSTCEIYLIASTSVARKGDGEALRAVGFDGFIRKPLNPLTLAAELRFWLEGPVSARASRFMWP
jgi:CheY-like chemotaxis protein